MRGLLEKIVVRTDSELLVRELLTSERARVISFLNAHAINLSVKSDEYYRALYGSQYLLRDGIGVKISCLLHGIEPGANMNGTDLIPLMINESMSSDIKIFFIGSEEENICILKEIYKGYKKSFFMNGYQNKDKYLKFLKDHLLADESALIILGMGMPKQELLSSFLRDELSRYKVTMVNGGAILSRLSGRESRAPKIYRMFALEWFYRLIKEPRRLFRRYVLGNPEFLFRAILSSLRGRE